MDMSLSQPALILASSSPHRRGLLQRLLADFDCISPEIDETPRNSESPAALADRLALRKAQAVADTRPGTVIIGGDQVAALDGEPLGKPGTQARARAQLVACAGREVVFHTAVCVIAANGTTECYQDLTRVAFRALDAAEIRRYVAREQPLDCAGAFRCEGLGIALFEYIDNRDPTALIGLPLIWLSGALRRAGIRLV